MIQWHPLFVHLLRPVLEAHYEVQTNVPVGDMPREADLLLLRRTALSPPPFQGVWKWLTTWNILEFKGQDSSPRLQDLDLLVELGLGIDRRLNQERQQQKQRTLAPSNVSFWYIVNRLREPFLSAAQKRLDALEPCDEGVWRCQVMERMVFLVSRVALPVNPESLPLHLVSKESLETRSAVEQLVRHDRALWRQFSPWLATLHTLPWKEIEAMARTKNAEGVELDLEALVKLVGMDRLVQTLGPKRLIDMIGPKRVLELMGPKRMIEEISSNWFLSSLTDEQRRDLKRRLK